VPGESQCNHIDYKGGDDGTYAGKKQLEKINKSGMPDNSRIGTEGKHKDNIYGNNEYGNLIYRKMVLPVNDYFFVDNEGKQYGKY